MNYLPWIFVVAVSYEVQGQTYNRRDSQGSATARGFPGLFCFRNNRIYFAGQQFPSSDGCNTCTCSGYDRVACTERACLPDPPAESPCQVGDPLPEAVCGGLLNLPCPDPDNYECVTRLVPGLFDGPGVCCGKTKPDLCQLPSETGRCRAYIPSWYYDSKEGRCKTFIYGGCGGNENRFPTEAACQQRCGKVVDVCELPRETGPCRASFPSWYFDSKDGRCKTFIYGGCGGNANRFPTEAACQQKCGKDLCKLPSEVGPCDGFNPSWYYNYDEKKCKQFIYGGCDGNANRFETQTECQQRCGEEPVCSKGQLPIPERTCGGLLPGNECPRGYTCVGDLVPVDGPGVCCPTDPEPVCSQGKPLPGRTCGGRRLGNQCPRGHQCEGEQLAFDGPGVCCPTDTGPSNLVCPTLPPDTFGICVELCPIEGCPTGQLCCSNGCGNVCKVGIPREAPTTHPLCPRLNPLVDVRCIRFEQCPQGGCPGRQQCCPSYCGTTCRAVRPPCGTQPPLRDSFGRQLFCGRGPNRVDCPSSHYCAIDPTDRYAVCCPYL